MSTKTMNISLPDSLKSFVDREVAEGGYATPSEYVRTLIRRARARKARALMEAQLVEALDEPPIEMTDQAWSQLKRRVRRRAKASRR